MVFLYFVAVFHSSTDYSVCLHLSCLWTRCLNWCLNCLCKFTIRFRSLGLLRIEKFLLEHRGGCRQYFCSDLPGYNFLFGRYLALDRSFVVCSIFDCLRSSYGCWGRPFNQLCLMNRSIPIFYFFWIYPLSSLVLTSPLVNYFSTPYLFCSNYLHLRWVFLFKTYLIGSWSQFPRTSNSLIPKLFLRRIHCMVWYSRSFWGSFLNCFHIHLYLRCIRNRRWASLVSFHFKTH